MKPATFLSAVALLSATIAYAAPASAPTSADVAAVDYEIKARGVEIEATNYEDEVEDFGVEDEDFEIEARALKNLPGLNAVQSSHARAIIAVNKKMKMGKQGCWAEVTMALTKVRFRVKFYSAAKSNLIMQTKMLVYASRKIPVSLQFKHDTINNDPNSLGVCPKVFQLWHKLLTDV
jgi:hypothetical protein